MLTATEINNPPESSSAIINSQPASLLFRKKSVRIYLCKKTPNNLLAYEHDRLWAGLDKGCWIRLESRIISPILPPGLAGFVGEHCRDALKDHNYICMYFFVTFDITKLCCNWLSVRFVVDSRQPANNKPGRIGHILQHSRVGLMSHMFYQFCSFLLFLSFCIFLLYVSLCVCIELYSSLDAIMA